MQADSPITPSRLIEYDGHPSQPTIVFVHGVFHGSWAFDEFCKPFSTAGYPVALLDLRGHWGSDRLTAHSNVGYPDFQDDLSRALDQIHGEKIVIGHSLGGLLALSLNSRPDVAACVLLAAPLPKAVRRKQWSLLFEFPIQTTRFLFSGNAAALYHHEPFTDRYFFSEHTSPRVKATANQRIRMQEEPARLFREVMALEFQPSEHLTPTLIVLGAEDPTVTIAVGQELQRLTGGQIVVVENSGHDIMLENSASLATRAILAWLSDRGTTSDGNSIRFAQRHPALQPGME